MDGIWGFAAGAPLLQGSGNGLGAMRRGPGGLHLAQPLSEQQGFWGATQNESMTRLPPPAAVGAQLLPRHTSRRDAALALLGVAGLVGACAWPVWAAAQAAQACAPLLRHRFPRLQDQAPQDLCQFAGQVLLVVNTASYCGFTRQYEGLEALHTRYGPRGLVVVGFPSNDFGQQEPGSAQQIADLCFNTYGVRFPMMAKTVVKGAGRNALYAQLAAATREEPQWNFHKYLIARDGKTVRSFASAVEPGSATLRTAIESALRARSS